MPRAVDGFTKPARKSSAKILSHQGTTTRRMHPSPQGSIGRRGPSCRLGCYPLGGSTDFYRTEALPPHLLMRIRTGDGLRLAAIFVC